jgi:addiction module HigA family antidote
MAKTMAEPIHPGEILLEEFLKGYDPPVSQTDAADRLGWTFVRLNQFVNGKRAVTAANAIALGELTGTSPEFWMNLQVRHDLRMAHRHRARRGVPKVRSLVKKRPALAQVLR